MNSINHDQQEMKKNEGSKLEQDSQIEIDNKFISAPVLISDSLYLSDVDESKDVVAEKYPNLEGNYFMNYGGLNVNMAVSTIMNDEQRSDFFKRWNKYGDRIVKVKDDNEERSEQVGCGLDYVQLNKYRFKKLGNKWSCLFIND
jgi:hypothetical protein